MLAPTAIMKRLTPQFELHLICRKRHLPLRGKTIRGDFTLMPIRLLRQPDRELPAKPQQTGDQ